MHIQSYNVVRGICNHDPIPDKSNHALCIHTLWHMGIVSVCNNRQGRILSAAPHLVTMAMQRNFNWVNKCQLHAAMFSLCEDMWESMVPYCATNTSEILAPNCIPGTRDVHARKPCNCSLSLENKIVLLRLAIFCITMYTYVCNICLHVHVRTYVYTNRSIHNI